MNLFINGNPRLTEWLVASGALRDPFVVADVGVQGGEAAHRNVLGDHLVVHGFDAIEEAVDELSQKNSKTRNRTYHWFAIGNEDTEREFYFKPGNPTNSSFNPAFYLSADPEVEARVVPMRRLDTLLRDGVIPVVDFLKIDVEGFEADVLRGAAELLGAGVLGVETETNFAASRTFPDSPFAIVQAALLQRPRAVRPQLQSRSPGVLPPDPQGARLAAAAGRGQWQAADLQRVVLPGPRRRAGRQPLLQTPAAPADHRPDPEDHRDLRATRSQRRRRRQRTEVLRRAWAAHRRGTGLDLLCKAEMPPSDAATLRQQLHSIHASTSWRITAPLRAIANNLKRRS